MNSIGIIHAGREDYYNKLGKEDYYTSEIDPRGSFHGRGAARLRIENTKIQQQDERLKHLFQGKSPDGTTTLRQGAYQSRDYTIWTYTNPDTQKVQTFRAEKHIPEALKDKVTETKKTYRSVVAYDNVMSAPKDVSVLWSQAPNNALREQLHRMHIRAVNDAIAYLDQHACYTRAGHNGTTHEKAEGVFAVFHHTTSRELDPQLHSHILMLNVGFNEQGEARALDGKKILDQRYTAGMVYQNTLRRQLEQELGVKTYNRPFEKGKGITFGIEGISTDLSRAMSTRAQQIEARITPEMSGAQVRAEALKSRKPKDLQVNTAQLFAKWQQQGDDHGFRWAKVVNRQHRQEKIQVQKLHRSIATSLQCKQKDRPLQESHLFNAVLGASKGRLSTQQAQQLVETYKTQYLRPVTVNTLVKERTADNQPTRYKVDAQETCYQLNAEGKKLVEYKSLQETLWSGAKTVITWHQQQRRKVRQQEYLKKKADHRQFNRRMTMLYATGNITRRQYLQFTQGKGLPQSEFSITVYQAFGLISKKQADYLRQKPHYAAQRQQRLLAWELRTKRISVEELESRKITGLTPAQVKEVITKVTEQKTSSASRGYERQRERERER
ncbi:exonuclease V subunit alpha [Tolypothrix tenuis PCC 7101]|uniref:Exonuclease V subunit alpha n=1 Tax=Tolypothrix tenuis PCC 7101 TaxID=231146 RepID=A0A1Z4N454_9CYAN|nr:relaxase domain-containing protein [Aulosira sp. FACHB-113]BAZ00504.1 exonuclease V subunit alpha [Tolypothrix tenuis PCC 7101]BAZ75574.1 exonuclease V subunit alpha [Aulosira laxa NIES-50]